MTKQRKGRVFMVNGAEVPSKYFTREQHEEDKLVAKAVKEYRRYQDALARFEHYTRALVGAIFERKEQERQEHAKDGKPGPAEARVTIYNIPRDRRIIIRERAKFQMSDLAVHAKNIIDAKIAALEEHLDSDEMKDLFALLKGMFIDKRKLCYTPAVSMFMQMRLKDDDLLKAQDLLRKAFTMDRGRLYYHAEEKGLDGAWGTVSPGYVENVTQGTLEPI